MENLQFDFTVDRTTNSVFVNRQFGAQLSLVWSAFTKKEILDQWWAPKPWVSKTRVMDFQVGGQRFYAMIGPEGQEHWSIEKYIFIEPKVSYKWISSFADKDERINEELASSEWQLKFDEQDGTTKVTVVIRHKTLTDLEMQLQMGFKEGFTMTLNELETLLSIENR